MASTRISINSPTTTYSLPAALATWPGGIARFSARGTFGGGTGVGRLVLEWTQDAGARYTVAATSNGSGEVETAEIPFGATARLRVQNATESFSLVAEVVAE